VYIDGIPQIESPYISNKPKSAQSVPLVPNFDKETAETLKHDGLPPLKPHTSIGHKVVFHNISSMHFKHATGAAYGIDTQSFPNGSGVLVAEGGRIICAGDKSRCAQLTSDADATSVNLEGGSISPGLVSYGSLVGLGEITGEPSTMDGAVPDQLVDGVSGLLSGTVNHAIDGLQFESRDGR
jgi:hypothetical protein